VLFVYVVVGCDCFGLVDRNCCGVVVVVVAVVIVILEDDVAAVKGAFHVDLVWF